MSTITASRIDQDRLLQANRRTAPRMAGIPFGPEQRPGLIRLPAANDARGDAGDETLSIEEQIARYIAANPAQLYRGGA